MQHPTIAPGVTAQHAAACATARGKRDCTCEPTYRARVRYGPKGAQRTASKTFSDLEQAKAWRLDARSAQGDLPASPAPAPTLQIAWEHFLARARAGEVLNRSGRPFAQATLDNYASVMGNHVLQWISPRFRVRLRDVKAGRVDARALQGMVSDLARHSAGIARLADAAVRAVLRDLWTQQRLPELPGRIVLPPPPRPRHSILNGLASPGYSPMAKD